MLTRRNMLKTSSLALGLPLLPVVSKLGTTKRTQVKHNFSFCLNTSTIRKQNLGLMGEMEVAAEAGYDGIEVWVSTVEDFVKNGGKLSEARKKAIDLGLEIESAISFPKWIVDDEAVRNEALAQAKKEMLMLADLGCKRIAAPPVGATEKSGLNLDEAAKRYNDLLKIGDETGVLPQLELWGFSANLHLFGEVLYVAAESGHPDACILPDVYHIYKGGSDFNSLKMLNGSAIHMFHVNDYPANPPRAQIGDKDRIYPGDGVAPLNQILTDLNNKKSPIVLSLELFNPSYWGKDALKVAKTGLQKMKTSVEKALS